MRVTRTTSKNSLAAGQTLFGINLANLIDSAVWHDEVGATINVLDHGAVPDASFGGPTPTDNLGPFNDALAEAIATNKTLYIPPGSYEFSNTWEITDSYIEIRGRRFISTLIFPDSLGIKILGHDNVLTGLQLKGGYGNQSDGYNSDIKHGLWLSGANNALDKIDVIAFDGHGMMIQGDTEHDPPTNANLNKILFCSSIANGNCGIYTQGGDANGCDIIGLNAAANARWNIKEFGFLYNNYEGFHVASGGNEHSLNQTSVSHGGKRYYCKVDNINKEPGVAGDWPTYWQLAEGGGVGGVNTFYKAWSLGNQYYSGGGVYTSGLNNQSTFDGYTEGDQIRVLRVDALGTFTGHISEHGIGGGALGFDKDGFIQTQCWTFGSAPPTVGMFKAGNIRFPYDCTGTGVYFWQCVTDSVVDNSNPYGDGGQWVPIPTPT